MLKIFQYNNVASMKKKCLPVYGRKKNTTENETQLTYSGYFLCISEYISVIIFSRLQEDVTAFIFSSENIVLQISGGI